MAKKEAKKALTRAQKTEATRQIVRELLVVKPTKHNELIDEVADNYISRHGEEGENLNDVRGRVGSVLDIMKKDSEVMYDGGMYALKARMMSAPVAESTPKKTRSRAKKAETPTEPVLVETPVEKAEQTENTETPAPKKRARAKKEGGTSAKETVAPQEEKPAPKKRGRKPKTEGEKKEVKAPAAEAPVENAEQTKKTETPVKQTPVEKPLAPAPIVEKAEEKGISFEVEKKERALVEKPKAEVAKNVVMDMSFLFGDKAKPVQKKEIEKREEKPSVQKAEEKVEKPASAKAPEKEEKKPVQPVKVEEKKVAQPPRAEEKKGSSPKMEKPKTVRGKGKEGALTPDERVKESFLKRMRLLGGDYFEYYSIYLLERYSIKNGRRLEGLRISGGDHDGGIDGELELTDTLGFKETIYIQSKNWDPEKGKEDKWVVGETLLQQFIGACACRQAKEGKIHARGIFITTSRFTPEAKRILEDMSDKIIGYDGNDLYETAKECEFGVIKKNGEWVLDEKLLSGPKAFFQM